MFKKKNTEVTLDGLSSTILENLIKVANDYSKRITQDMNSPFYSMNENIIMTELLMLTFWNLKALNCPSEIYDAVLRQYFETLEQLNADRTVYSKLLEYRFAQYNCSWSDSRKKLPFIASVFLQNIHEKLMSDNKAEHFVVTFLSQINELNSGLLKLIKKEMKIV